MSLFPHSWGPMEDAALNLIRLQPESLGELNEAIKLLDFLPLLALCLWHTDLLSVPPFTRMFALTALTAACYPNSLKKENFGGALGTYLHNVIGDLFTYPTSLDAFFCTLSFVYKGIILEARMGTRRFFNLVFLLAASIGSVKFLLQQTRFTVEGGMYPLLISLKVVINYTCLFHHPIRFPILHPFLSRRLRFFEFFIALVRTRSPQDIILGMAAGTALIAGLNNPNSFIHPLLGEDGSKARTVSATKMIFRGRSGGVCRWVKTVLPNLITSLWLLTAITSYTTDHKNLPSFLDPLWTLKTFDPMHPATWVAPTHGVVSFPHFAYLLFLVYRTPSTFAAAFKDGNVASICFFAILPLSRMFSLVLLNIAHACSPFSLWCIDFSKRFSDSCSVLLAANTFAEVIAVTPETVGNVLIKMGMEMAMIWKFFPEVHLLSAIGAYTAGILLAVVSILIDPDRLFLADLPKASRKTDVLVMKNPKRQIGSVTESSSTDSNSGAPPSSSNTGGITEPEPDRSGGSSSFTFTKQDTLKKLNIRAHSNEKKVGAKKEVRGAGTDKCRPGEDADNVTVEKEFSESSKVDLVSDNQRDNERKPKQKRLTVPLIVS